MINVWDFDGGEGAAGKSLIELQQAVAHALNVKWLDAEAMPGKTLFIDAEDGDQVIHKRLADILQHHAKRFADLKDRFYPYSLLNQDPVLAALGKRSGRIEPTPMFDSLTEMVGDIKPILTVIASSANVFAGNEIDRSQVQQFVSMLTRLAILASGSVVLISHPSLAGINTDTGLSGSTQWHNAVRARFYIKGVKSEEGEPRGNRRVIEFRKNQYGPVSSEILLEYRNGLFVPVDNTTVDRAVREQQADDAFLEVARLLIAQNQDLSPMETSHNYAPTKIAEHPRSGTIRKEELKAAMQRLLDAGRIHILETGPASKRKKQLRLGTNPNPMEPAL
jgi:RecA-family ATPase